MKRALYFVIIYLVSLLVGTLVFATLFMFSCNLSMFVTGSATSFFSLHFLMSGIMISFPLVAVLTQILLILYMIRHPKNQLISMILYLIFGALSWLLLIPTDLKLITRYEADSIHARVEATSSGIFRKEKNGIFYYSRIDEKNRADGIFIDTTGSLGTQGTVMPFFDSPVSNESAFPYSDSLIKDSLQVPKLVTYPLAIYNAILTSANYSVSLGIFAWLGFASLGLALLAMYSVQFASSWKLANVAILITVTLCIVLVNYLYYMNILPDILREISFKLTEFSGIKDSLIIAINLLISVLLFIFGIFMGIYRLRGNALLESEE